MGKERPSHHYERKAASWWAVGKPGKWGRVRRGLALHSVHWEGEPAEDHFAIDRHSAMVSQEKG